MQRFLGALTLSLFILSCGGSPGFAGDYNAEYMGQAVSLHLEESDGTLSGRLTYAGLTSDVDGVVSGARAEGRVNAGLMGQLPFEAELQSDDALQWKYLLPLPGQAQALELDFIRSGQQTTAQPESDALDPRLVGRWRRTVSNSVPGTRPVSNLNVATDIFCTLAGDGSFSYGGSVTGAASPGIAGTTGPGSTSSGHWKAEGGVLYSQAQGQSQWIPLGRYALSGASLVLYVGTEKQLWERQ